MTTLGLDIGGTFAKSVILDRSENVIDRRTDRVPEANVLDFVVELAARRLEESGSSAVGLGLAGLVKHPEGEFLWGPHVEGRNVPYLSALVERLARPVFVDNDANLAALAEARLGAGRHYRHMAMITFGTGIGAGLVFDQEIYRGRSYAGEVGHMIVEPNGDLCACGRRGCWETKVSGARLDQIAAGLASASPDGLVASASRAGRPTGKHLVEAAERGDPAARRALADAGRWLGLGVAMLVTVLDPECVIVGGAAADAGEWLLEPARKLLAEDRGDSDQRETVPLIPAELGRWAGAVGAALAAQTATVDEGPQVHEEPS